MAPMINNKTLLTLLLLSSNILAAPLARRQLHGEGVAADALLTDTDNGVGYGTENAEDNLASLITSIKGGSGSTSTGGSGSPPPPPPPPPSRARRQLHGEGVAADAILTDTDNGVGYGTENAEDNLASLITSIKPARRQLDKIANGAGNVLDAAGANRVANVVVPELDTIDGQTTDDAANIGTQVGGDEETILEQAGSDVPSNTGRKNRRQLDKIANGAGSVLDAAGANSVADATVPVLDSADGTLTDDAANAGTDTGNTEATTLENAGSSVPSKLPK